MDFSSKLSIYDLLTMFISGSIILVVLFNPPVLAKCCHETSYFSFLIPLLFSTIAYFVGMIWHKFLEYILGRECIKNFLERMKDIFRSFNRNSETLLMRAELDFHKNNNLEENFFQKGGCIKRRYYFAYYYLQEKQSLGNIPILEAQEAFLRDIILPFVAFIISSFFPNGTPADILQKANLIPSCIVLKLVIITATFIALLLIHASIQKKIYSLVWEGSYFISRLEDLRKNGTIMADPCCCRHIMPVNPTRHCTNCPYSKNS